MLLHANLGISRARVIDTLHAAWKADILCEVDVSEAAPIGANRPGGERTGRGEWTNTSMKATSTCWLTWFS